MNFVWKLLSTMIDTNELNSEERSLPIRRIVEPNKEVTYSTSDFPREEMIVESDLLAYNIPTKHNEYFQARHSSSRSPDRDVAEAKEDTEEGDVSHSEEKMSQNVASNIEMMDDTQPLNEENFEGLLKQEDNAVAEAKEAEEEEEEEIFETDILKERMDDIRLQFTTSSQQSDFASSRPLPSPPLDLLHIEGINHDISLPITLDNILRLKERASLAPFGKGTQTIVDTNVRNVWQINGSDVTTPTNPDFFGSTMQIMVRDSLRIHLGIDADAMGIEAKLYKLLLYETGGHFLLHCDTEKEKGMFATYLLQVPVEGGYSGGSLLIKHGTKEKIFETTKDCESKFYETMFYADCEHQLNRVESGYRCVLAFNLLWKKRLQVGPNMKVPMMITTPSHCKEVCEAYKDLDKLVGQWEKLGVIEQPFLAFRLEHKYTESNLSFRGLKGNDSKLAQYFMGMKGKLDVYLCLQSLHILKSGTEAYNDYYEDYDDYDDEDEDINSYRCSGQKRRRQSYKPDTSNDEEFDRDYSSSWISSNDEKVEGLTLNVEESIVGEEIDEDLGIFNEDDEPDDIEYGGYTGNEGVTNEYWYYQAFLVLTPTKFAEDLEIMHSFDSFLRRITRNLQIIPTTTQIFKINNIPEVHRMVKKVPLKIQKSIGNDMLMPMIVIARMLQEMQLCNALLDKLITSLATSCKCTEIFNKNLFSHWYYMINSLGWNAVRTRFFEVLWKKLTDKQLMFDFMQYVGADRGDIILSDEVFDWMVEVFFRDPSRKPYVSQFPEAYSLNMIVRLMKENRRNNEITSDLKSFINDSKNISPNILQNFISLHAADVYRSASPEIKAVIKDIAQQRLRFVEGLLHDSMRDTWALPAEVVQGDIRSEVVTFLRSESRSFVAQGLNGISHARNYAAKYLSRFSSYGIQVSTGGTGPRAFVRAEKTSRPHVTQIRYRLTNFVQQITKALATMQSTS